MAYKRVTDCIIAKDVATGNDGFVRALKGDQSAILGSTGTIATDPIIYMEQTLATTANKILSLPIHGLYVTGWTGKSAANGVAHQVTVGVPNVISDQEYGLFIHNTWDKEMVEGNRRYYVQYFSDSSATATEIANGLVSAINNNNNPLYKQGLLSAANSGNTIVITALKPGVYFSVGKAIGFDSSVTVTTSANADPGQGTYDQVFAFEDAAKGYKGYLGERRTFVGDLPGFGRPTYFATGTAGSLTAVYDTYVIEHSAPFTEQVVSTISTKPITTAIFVPAGWGQQSTFETAMNSWMASLPGGFAAVNL
jgi:hypothetical protein